MRMKRWRFRLSQDFHKMQKLLITPPFKCNMTAINTSSPPNYGTTPTQLRNAPIASIYVEAIKAKEMPMLLQSANTLLAKIRQNQYGATDRMLLAQLILSGVDGMYELHQSRLPRDKVQAIECADQLRRLIDDAVRLDPNIKNERYTIYSTKQNIRCIEYSENLLRKMPTYMG
jgi:hypothetical protein